MKTFIIILIYIIGAPLIGGIISGLDRIINAKMQSRVGPPLWQPFYDVLKLLQKENLVVRRSQNFYIFYFFLLIIFTGALFFIGEDILLVIFALTLACIFFVLAGYKASSPYSFIGAQRELLQIMAYEPAVILVAIGMYMVTGSFVIKNIVSSDKLLFMHLPGVLVAFIFILAIKFRKSPFDLSTSHHAHQEVVKGITTEFSGKALAMIEVGHWYENVLVLGFVYLFFAKFPVVGIVVSLLAYFVVIFIDNCFARVKWQVMVVSAWLVALIFGAGNIILLHFLKN